MFATLQLWVVANHDGISQPNELHSLPELGVYSISLHYESDRNEDVDGNWFHCKAALNPNPLDGTSRDGRWTYDVFLLPAKGSTTANCPGKSNPKAVKAWHRADRSIIVRPVGLRLALFC